MTPLDGAGALEDVPQIQVLDAVADLRLVRGKEPFRGVAAGMERQILAAVCDCGTSRLSCHLRPINDPRQAVTVEECVARVVVVVGEAGRIRRAQTDEFGDGSRHGVEEWIRIR